MAGKGGRRSTSFAPTWNLGKTDLIRIPVAIIDKIRRITKIEDNGKNYEQVATLENIDRFIEYQRNKYGKNNAQKGEFSIDGSRWYYLNEFRKWVENGERNTNDK